MPITGEICSSELLRLAADSKQKSERVCVCVWRAAVLLQRGPAPCFLHLVESALAGGVGN